MKKSIFIGIMLFYNFIISLIIGDLSITSSGTAIPNVTTGNAFDVFDIFSTLGDMTTFSVEGVSDWIILICFYIPNIVLILAISGFIFNRDN